MRASEFPRDFCVAVVGHPGWDTHVDATAPYALCVTFELTKGQLPLYSALELELDDLQAELGLDIST